jgi:diaminopimelate decarboxylase
VGQVVLTDSFPRIDGVLHAESIPLAMIAAGVGTPAFVYSAQHLRDRYTALTSALDGVPHHVHYSLKANACRGVLQVLRELGCGVDVVSGGELFRALAAGFAPADILFGGVGKSDAEIVDGVRAGVKLLNVESRAEITRVAAAAEAAKRVVDIGIRVNPEVEVSASHAYIETGESGHKFGVPSDEVAGAIAQVVASPWLRLRAIVMHVGSQLQSLDAYRAGATRLVEIAAAAKAVGAKDIAFLDIGGGLAVRYDDEQEPDLAAFAAIVREAHEASGLTILLEPGRYLVANSGVLLTNVLYRKRSGPTEYVITDAGMTELIRPSHYDAYHRIEPVAPTTGTIRADIVGPVCETGDFLARDREVADVAPGALLAVFSVGAYGYVMASHYNARPRPAEVLVDGDRWAVVTARETYADLVRHERTSLDWRTA